MQGHIANCGSGSCVILNFDSLEEWMKKSEVGRRGPGRSMAGKFDGLESVLSASGKASFLPFHEEEEEEA